MDENNSQPVQEETVQEDTQKDTPEKDRTTQQFDKLTNSNKELKQERDQAVEEAKQYKNVLDSLLPDQNAVPSEQQTPQFTPPQQPFPNPFQNIQPPSANQYQNLNQQQVDDVYQGMIDENGYLDGNKLTQTLRDLDQKAKKAELRAQQIEEHMRRKEAADRESVKTTVTKQVHEAYPQIDPESDQFDPELYDAVRNEMIGQMVNNGTQDFMGASKKWYDKLYGGDGMKKADAQKAKNAQNQKIQSSANRPRSNSMAGYYAQEQDNDLVQAMRQGKKGAVAEMLKRKGL